MVVSSPASRIHPFGLGKETAADPDPAILGGKGAGLVEMAALGLPVPPGFVIPPPLCAELVAGDEARLIDAIRPGLAAIEHATGQRIGDPARPLLLSVRSGARQSMPGMLETVLNVGLTPALVAAYAGHEGDARFAWDTYRRLLRSWGEVIAGLDPGGFEDALEIAKEDRGVETEAELQATDLQRLAQDHEMLIEGAGAALPTDPEHQLARAISAVCASWGSARARSYRQIHRLEEGDGTAITVQAMVFGNRGPASASGVAFSRDPSTGAADPLGEYLSQAQGEEIVSGQRTPHHLTSAARRSAQARTPAFEEIAPEPYAALRTTLARLERHFGAVQDVEWTVEEGRLWLLQTRAARLSPEATVACAVAMAEEGLISRQDALARVGQQAIDRLQRPVLDPAASNRQIGAGLPASPGIAVGIASFDAADAIARAGKGEAVILIRADTSPDDVAGIHAAVGVLTGRGGMTSHAAVVARGLGRPCVTGLAALSVDPKLDRAELGGVTIRPGDWLTIDGGSGAVLLGQAATIKSEPAGPLATLLSWRES